MVFYVSKIFRSERKSLMKTCNIYYKTHNYRKTINNKLRKAFLAKYK